MNTPLAQPSLSAHRWLGLEIGRHSYAVELAMVSAVYYDAQESTANSSGAHRPFLNLQGLTIKDGKPVFLMPAADLFEADQALAFGQDTFANSNSVPPWVVVFSVEVEGALLGVRVDRTSGPFRAQGAEDQSQHAHQFVRLKQEYLDSAKRETL